MRSSSSVQLPCTQSASGQHIRRLCQACRASVHGEVDEDDGDPILHLGDRTAPAAPHRPTDRLDVHRRHLARIQSEEGDGPPLLLREPHHRRWTPLIREAPPFLALRASWARLGPDIGVSLPRSLIARQPEIWVDSTLVNTRQFSSVVHPVLS